MTVIQLSSLRGGVPKWGRWGVLVALLGCFGDTGSGDDERRPPPGDPSSTRDGDGRDGERLDDAERLEGEEDYDLRVERIPGESFGQIWGTTDELWILGGPTPPEPVETEATLILPCPRPSGLAPNIARRNRGQGWEAMALPASSALTRLHGSSARDVWMIGVDGAALSFDGERWTEHDVRATDGLEFQAEEPCAELSLHSVFARAPDDVWVVGYIYPSSLGPGLILHFDGESWRRDAIDAGDGLFDVWASSASDAWVVGSSGLMFHFDGERWQRADGKTEHYLFSVLGTEAGQVWAAGNRAVTTRFDGGEWALVDSGKDYASRFALAGGAGAGPWALEVVRRPSVPARQSLVRWDGRAWIEQSSVAAEAAELADLWFTPSGQLWGVGSAIARLR